jgi:hypothetical protein
MKLSTNSPLMGRGIGIRGLQKICVGQLHPGASGTSTRMRGNPIGTNGESFRADGNPSADAGAGTCISRKFFRWSSRLSVLRADKLKLEFQLTGISR